MAALTAGWLAAYSVQAVEPGGPSYADQAERALVAGDLKLAVDLYGKWIEADPGDYVSWYNYACALALNGDTGKALLTLDDAITAGWRDSSWTANDPDLASLNRDSEFVVLLGRMGRLVRLEKAKTAERSLPHYVTQKRLAPYELRLPTGYLESGSERYPLILLLHNRGDDYTDMDDLATRLALPKVIYAMPRAPYAMSDGKTGYEYWPRELAASGDREQSVLARKLTGKWLADVVRDAESRVRVDTAHVILVGYSQGGAAAYVAAMENPSLFQGVASLGGYIPESHRDSTWFRKLGEQGVALFIGHGSRDRVIEPTEAAYAREMAEAAGIDVTVRMYPAEHELPDEMVVDLASWIQARLQGERLDDELEMEEGLQ